MMRWANFDLLYNKLVVIYSEIKFVKWRYHLNADERKRFCSLLA